MILEFQLSFSGIGARFSEMLVACRLTGRQLFRSARHIALDELAPWRNVEASACMVRQSLPLRREI
jgi:hypothetical protein